MENRGNYFLIENLYHETKLPCLRVYCSGRAAIEMEKKIDMVIQKEILMILSKIFPAETPLPYPIETVLTRWNKSELPDSLQCDLPQVDSNDPRLIWAYPKNFDSSSYGYVDGTICAYLIASLEIGRQAAIKAANVFLGDLR